MTAVEWLQEQLKDVNYNPLEKNGYSNALERLFEQAKEMEKQQIIKTWYDCKLSIIERNPTDAEQYYNKTFKKQIMRISQISLFRLEYNEWNGFIFEVLSLEIGSFERDLFSISINSLGLQIGILFLNINIK